MSTENNKLIDIDIERKARWPMLVLTFPAFANKYVMASQTHQVYVEAYTFISLVACYILFFVQPEYRALFISTFKFKIGSSLVYFGSLVPMLILKLYFPDSELNLFSDLFFIVGLIFSIFYFGHFYKPKYLVGAGWVKSPKLKSYEVTIQNSDKPSSTAAWIMLFIICLVVLFVVWLR